MDLRGRTALVTGAGRRLGQAIAIALGSRGMHVVVHHHGSADGAGRTAAAIAEAGGTATTIAVDLTAPDAPDRLLGAFDTARLAVLVNSAAVMTRTPVGQVTVAQWDALFALNLRAPFFLAQAASNALSVNGGTIVNIADIAAYETWPGYVPYSLTKSGMVHMTASLARAMAPRVRVNAVAPGAVVLPEAWDEGAAERLAQTTPLGRLGSADDVVRAVLYLVDADYVTGQTIAVDGGRLVRV